MPERGEEFWIRWLGKFRRHEHAIALKIQADWFAQFAVDAHQGAAQGDEEIVEILRLGRIGPWFADQGLLAGDLHRLDRFAMVEPAKKSFRHLGAIALELEKTGRLDEIAGLKAGRLVGVDAQALFVRLEVEILSRLAERNGATDPPPVPIRALGGKRRRLG